MKEEIKLSNYQKYALSKLPRDKWFNMYDAGLVATLRRPFYTLEKLYEKGFLDKRANTDVPYWNYQKAIEWRVKEVSKCALFEE